MEVYCVYLGDVYLVHFKNYIYAQILFNGLQIFLNTHDMDVDLVRITTEVI